MKKLMIALLVGMLCLGLSGVAFAATSGTGEQDVDAKIESTLTFTVPTQLTGWILLWNVTVQTETADKNTTYDNTTPTAVSPHTAVVNTNIPYILEVNVSTAVSPSYEGTPDNKMTTSYDGTEVDLTTVFVLKWNDTGGSAGATDTTGLGVLTDITTTAQTFVTATSAPDDGTAYLGIEFGQTIAEADAAYDAGVGQLSYQIKLTWTATGTLT